MTKPCTGWSIVTLAASLLAGSSACQIFDFAPIPCSEDSHCPADFECGPADVCVPIVNKAPPDQEPTDEGPLREVDDGCDRSANAGVGAHVTLGTGASHGVAALLAAPGFGAGKVYVVAPADCRDPGSTLCPTTGTVLDNVPMPTDLAGEASVRVLRDGSSPVAPTEQELELGFAVEVVFRNPTLLSAPQQRLVWQSGDGESENPPASGWALMRFASQQGDGIGFVTNDVAVGFVGVGDGRWLHMLCVVDAQTVRRGDPDAAVICALDGSGAFSAVSLGDSHFGFDNAPLQFGEEPVAMVTTWVAPELPSEAVARRDAVVALARKRLLAFTGVTLTGAEVIEVGQPFTSFDAKLFPMLGADLAANGTGYVRVGMRWPRTQIVPDGRALLVEPERTNLLAPLRRAGNQVCTAAPEPVQPPLGAACLLELDEPLRATISSDVAADSTLVFSAFVSLPLIGSEASVAFDLQDDSVIQCSLDPTNAGCNDGTRVTLGEQAGDFTRLVVHLGSLPSGLKEVRVDGVDAAIWSAQVEAGLEPSSPLGVQPDDPAKTGDDFYSRVLELYVLDTGAVGAAAGVLTTARLALMPQSGLLTTLQVTDDFDDGVGLATAAAQASGSTITAFATEGISGGTAESDLASTSRSSAVTVGAVFGAIAACDTCDVSVTVDDHQPFDGRYVLIAPGDESSALLGATVDESAGGELLRRNLDLAVEPRVVGCAFDGSTPVFDASLQPCDDGLCSRDGSSWADDVVAVPGPSVGEQAFGTGGSTALQDTVGGAESDLIVELRFRADAAGTVARLVNRSGDERVLFSADGEGAVAVRVGSANASFDVPVGAWVQLTCWIGASAAACLRNLSLLRMDLLLVGGDAIDPEGTAVLDDGFGDNPLGTVAFGDTVGPVSVVRGHAIASLPAEEADSGALFVAADRALRSFGVHTSARRAFVLPSMVGGTPAVLERRLDSGRVPFLVSAGWPRTTVDDGPALLFEPSLADDLPDDLQAAWEGGATLSDAVGPAALTAFTAKEGTQLHHSLTLGGTVSIYARKVDGDPVLTLRAGGASKRFALASDRFDSNAVYAADGWVRVLISTVDEDGSVDVEVDNGSAELSTPQIDRNGVLSAPLLDDAPRPHDRLALFTGDLSTSLYAGNVTVDASSLGTGVTYSVLTGLAAGADSAWQGMEIGRAGEDVFGTSVQLNPALDTRLEETLTATFSGLGDANPLLVSWRGVDFLVRGAGVQRRALLLPPVLGAQTLMLGNVESRDSAQISVRTLRVEPTLRLP